eukprot:3339383-Alexandrium_andersonii.AAC.1
MCHALLRPYAQGLYAPQHDALRTVALAHKPHGHSALNTAIALQGLRLSRGRLQHTITKQTIGPDTQLLHRRFKDTQNRDISEHTPQQQH